MASKNQDTAIVRTDFIEAFAHLYAQSPLKDISVATLCNQAGYSRSTFYRHFDCMDDVLQALEDTAVPYDEMRSCTENAENIDMRKFTDYFLGYLCPRKEVLGMLLRQDTTMRFYRKLHHTMSPAFRAQAARVFDMSAFELDVLAEYLTSAKLSLLRLWATSPVELDLAYMTKITDSTLEGALWDRVEEASRCRREGRKFKKVSIDELAETRPWIAFRY